VSYDAQVVQLSLSTLTGQSYAAQNIVIVFLLRIEVDSLDVGVLIAANICLRTIAYVTVAMVKKSTRIGMTASRLVMVTSLRGHALVFSFRVQTAPENYVAVGYTHTSVSHVHIAKSLIVSVVNSTIICVTQ
jgi:hypothetical protein